MIGDGQLTVGGVLSTTVTVKLQEEKLPLASVALALTVVVPTGKVRGDVIGEPAMS